MTTSIPKFQPGQNPTLRANPIVDGARFVVLKTGVNAVEGIAQAEYPGAGRRPFGVSAFAAAAGETFTSYRGGVVEVTANGALSHGQRIMSDSIGRAVAFVGSGPVAASVAIGVVGANSAIRVTAREDGADGNNIRIRVAVAGNNTALGVVLAGNDITVNSATDAGGVATSTATQIIAALQASAAMGLIEVANEGASSGVGIPGAIAYTPLTGGDDDAVNHPAGVVYADAADGAKALIALELGA